MMAHTPSVDGWTNRMRRGLPLITPLMFEVLVELRAAADADSPFIHLPNAHPHTLRSLLNRDWIFKSPGLDGVRYKLTGRGLKALKVYEPVERRRDGMCPDCGERPKHVRKSGKVDGYCTECLRKSSRRKYRMGRGKKQSSFCPRCKQRPRHRQPGGAVITYCEECSRELKRQAKTEKRRRQLALLHAGGFIKCSRDGCDNCVHFTEKSVFDLCQAHQREYMNDYNDKRRANSRAARARRQRVIKRAA